MRIKLFTLLLLLSQTAWAQTRQTDPITYKMGFIDAKGNTLIPLEYDFLESRFEPLMVGRKGDFKGVIDSAGRIRIPFDYHDIQPVYPYFLVTKDRSAMPTWGILDDNGKVILPMMYEYIGMVDSNLLAARLFNSKALQFFDRQGEKLFGLEGASVKRGFDTHSILIQRANRSHYWADRQGNPIALPLFENLEWSDGDYAILIKNGRFGVVNSKGETVVPFKYLGLIPGNKGHFIVSDTTSRDALLDANGKIMIPPGSGQIIRLGKQEGDGYFRHRGEDFESKYYAPDGKTILHDACNVLPVIPDSRWSNIPEQYYERYDWVEVKATGRGLYRSNGVQILPPKFKHIKYCSERHPLLAFTLEDRANGYQDYGGTAYDLKGKQLLKQRYFSLNFTENPRFLIGQPTPKGLYGFIDLSAPEKAEFIFQELERLPNGHYRARKDGLEMLLSPDGKLLEAPVMQKVEKESIMEVPELEVMDNPTSVAPNEVIGYGEAEKMPQFPGGEAALTQFLATNLKYPAIASENGIEGQVVVSFIVEKDGSLSDAKILRDIGGGCGQAALRLVSQMPKWSPGAHQGKPVRVRYTMPVKFKLSG